MVSKIGDSTRLELIYLDSKEHHPDHVILMNWNEDRQLLEKGQILNILGCAGHVDSAQTTQLLLVCLRL